jgi:hypothetical protein
MVIVAVHESENGTFRTCQVGLTMSVHRGTADLTVASADFRV